MEIELKVVLSVQNLQKLLQSQFFQTHTVPQSEQILYLVTTYFDTEDFSLRNKGIAYRVRSTKFADGHKEYESTTKRTLYKNGAVAEREEINKPQEDDKPCYENVRKLFATQVTRKLWLLQFDGALFEMAVDKGQIMAVNGKTASIDEVEFEIKQGTKANLEKLRMELQKVVPLQGEEQSKYARGLALLGVK